MPRLMSRKLQKPWCFCAVARKGFDAASMFYFNDITDLIISTPENNQIYREVRNARMPFVQANTQGGPKAEIAAATKALDEVQSTRGTNGKARCDITTPSETTKTRRPFLSIGPRSVVLSCPMAAEEPQVDSF